MSQEGLTLTTCSPEETMELGRAIGRVLRGGDTVFLEGPLGAGKTVLAQGIGVGMGVTGHVQSPSFVLERIYEGTLFMRHVDLYRLEGDEASESGLLVEPDSESVLVIEWAQKIHDDFPWAFRVRLERAGVGEGKRQITLWGKKAPDVYREYQRNRNGDSRA